MDVLGAPKGAASCRHRATADFWIVLVDGALLGALAAEGGFGDGPELRPAFAAADPRTEWIVAALLAELEAGEPDDAISVEALLNLLCVRLLRRYSAPVGRMRAEPADARFGGTLPRTALKRVLDYVGDNLAEQVTLGGMAREANLSPNHFASLFKEATGLPPHRYVVRERVEKTRMLLEGTELPLVEAARMCGGDGPRSRRCCRRDGGQRRAAGTGRRGAREPA